MDYINYENTVSEYLEASKAAINELYKIDFLDVSETISELSYLTHDFFRYYGKFPSKVAKYIIEYLVTNKQISNKNDLIFDNYNGSGTALVEAKLAGFISGGIDINPFAVLASNVKTYNYNICELKSLRNLLFSKIDVLKSTDFQATLSNVVISEDDVIHFKSIIKQIYVDFPDVDKWFEKDTIYELGTIKYCILSLPHDVNREFFTLGFFAIIRRVSKAYDAEVRPHVNPKKKSRNAFEAFVKKINEMISTMESWNQVTENSVISVTNVCDNTDSRVTTIISDLCNKYNKKLGLVISHPPYLNCFDYIQVYRLKFLWAFGFNEIYGELTYPQIKKEEIKSYPASTDKLVNNYFKHNMAAYKIVYDNLNQGGYCCIVIGDCTIRKNLLSVHKIMIKGMESLGFVVDKVTYRSTNYGLGRYAYKHKADYNDNDDGKKDAIIFFKKPNY